MSTTGVISKTVAEVEEGFLQAVQKADITAIDEALNFGINVNVRDEQGRTALELANNVDVLNLLLNRYGPLVNPETRIYKIKFIFNEAKFILDDGTSLSFAALYGMNSLIQHWLKSNDGVITLQNKNCSLKMAAITNRQDLLKIFLSAWDKEIDLDTKKDALVLAVKAGSIETTTLLLEKYGNELTAQHKEEIITKAIKYKRREVIKLLLSKQPIEIGTFPQKINIQLIELSRIIIINSDLQLQLLEYITHYNDSEMLALFFSKSGKSFYKGAALYFNLQLLEYITRYNNNEMLALFFNKHGKDFYEGKALEFAVENNQIDIARTLLEENNVTITSWSMGIVLKYAAENDDIDLLDLVLPKCKDDINLGPALRTAAEKNHVQIMRKLLEKSNIIPSYVKNTIVSDAINNDHSTVIEVIIEQYGEELEEYNIRYAVTYALENDNGSIITALSKHSSKLTSKERLNVFLAAARLGLDAAFTTLLHQHAHEFTRQAKQGALIKTAQHDHQALTEMLYASMGIDEQKQTLEEMIRQRQVAAVNLILKYQRSVFCSTLLKREINADENQNVLMNPMPDIELPRALADLIQGMTTIPPSSSHEELCSEYAKHLTILAKTGWLSADNMGTDIYSTVAEHSSFMISSGFIDQSDLTEEDTSTNPTGSRTTFSHDQLNIDDTVPKNIYNPYMIIGATSLVGWSSFGIAISIMQNISFIKALLCYTASIALGISFLTGTAIAYSFDNTTLAESMTGPHITL
jgi:ankyrin repeat protein